MRYPASEKAKIIRLVEASHLPALRTLDKLGTEIGRASRMMTRLAGTPESTAELFLDEQLAAEAA